MKLYFQKKVLLGFFVAISIITWLSIYAYSNNRKFKETAEWVLHTNQVLFHAEQILSLTIDIESGQRGYTVTDDAVFLEPYHAGRSVVLQHIKDLQALTADNPRQQERIAVLSDLVEKKLKFAHSVIEMHATGGGRGADAVATLQGKRLMDDIRKVIRDFQKAEKILLEKRSALHARGVQRANEAFFLLLATTAVILVLVFVSIHINLRGRVKAEESLHTAMMRIHDIYDRAPCGYHSLDADGFFEEINQTWLRWIGYAKTEVVKKVRFNDILTAESSQLFLQLFPVFKTQGSIHDQEFEVVRKDGTTFPVILSAQAVFDDQGNYLKSRSTVFDYSERKRAAEKILQLNHELEAFTYSVSHDLRAPLRSIDGYGRILSEDHAGQLDAEGQRILNTIIKNANKMGRLIDDLLDFSRYGRKELNKANYNMEQLASSVFEELKDTEKSRTIHCHIHNVLPAYSDPTLIRQVWTNLISNALKYSRKREASHIEITSQKTGGEIVYSIKDNGTGFDMQYYHKLFNVFQRLHRPSDFEGTGVGLAIVQRIVSRHDGRVWAEAKENEGATFYFSIPHEPHSQS
ncbi:MAG TPA: CHASE3 domain-containing protein [Ohtaekwangia sp.]|nr:CHASE3 domain-containing protein [Ohtaekwangia sp.]